MTSMPGMEMPGRWTMSMMWMRMAGQSWAGSACTFIGMWCVMMVALYLSTRRWLRRGHEGQALHLTRMASSQVLFGSAFLPYALSFGFPHWWEMAVAASVVGILPGLISGRRQVRKWEVELLSGARSGEHPNEIAWPLPSGVKPRVRLFLVLFVALPVVSYLMDRLSSTWFDGVAPPALGLGGGYFATIGWHTWFWARSKESQGRGPILIRPTGQS